MVNEVKIFLTPSDAHLFAEFRRVQDIFGVMVEKGVFELRGGSATLHFDADGILRKVDKSETIYRT